MNNIFIGMLLVFLDFNIDINASRIGLIPDFLGYIFMLRGTAELVMYSPRFRRVRPHITAMAVYSAILYVMDLLGFSTSGYFGASIISIILGLVSIAFTLYISYNIVIGIMEIETTNMYDLGGARLYSVWKVQAVVLIILHLLWLFPVPGAILGILVGFIISVYYLFVFNRTRKLFYGVHW